MKVKLAHNLGWIIAAGLAGLYGVEMHRTNKLNKIVDVATKAVIIQLPELNQKINEVIQKEKKQKTKVDSAPNSPGIVKAENPQTVNALEDFKDNPKIRFSFTGEGR